jgi:type IV pilus assembly protein PilA
MSNKLKELRAKEGFTIIEVIIVLVIGAVIMLAVFLVVPQLQRTQRNTSRQAAARAVLAAAQQYASNNNGTAIPNAAASTTNTNITGITGVKNDPSSNTSYSYVVQSNGTTAAVTTQGTITLATSGAKCNGNELASGNGAAVVVGMEGGTFCVSDSN